MSDLWEELRQINSSWLGPWVIGGDFNTIRFIYEKSPVNRRIRSMRDFNAFIQDYCLRDCP